MTAMEQLSREDRFVRTTNRVFLGYAGAFAIWQVADVLRGITAGGVQVALRVLSLTAWAAWSALLIVTLMRKRTAEGDPALRAAFEDERATHLRLRAYRLAFWVTVAFAAMLGILGAAHIVEAETATRFIVVVGITTFIVGFVVLDGE